MRELRPDALVLLTASTGTRPPVEVCMQIAVGSAASICEHLSLASKP
jgi:hypothetical protein